MNNSNEKKSLISVIVERLVNGILKENPTFVLLLGMCPTLAVTTSAINGFGMGATTLVVLALSNMMISALRKVIPDKIRIPAFIVIIASFVTIVELLLNAYITSLYEALGLYIPLIVVNCIILGRAEAYAYSNPVIPSLFDGIGMGVGFTFALTIIGGFREILGNGSIFGARIMPNGFVPVSIFVMAPGAFFVLAMLTAIQNAVKIAGTKRGHDMSKIQSGCGGNCLECSKDCKVEIVTSDEDKTDEVSSDTKKESETEAVNDAASGASEETESETKEPETNEATSEGAEVKESGAETSSDTDNSKEDETVIASEISVTSESEAEAGAAKSEAEQDIKPEDIVSEEETSETSEVEATQTSEASSEGESTLDNDISSETENAESLNSEEEVLSESESETESESESVISSEIPSDDDEIEVFELKKSVNKNTKTGKKPARKKSSMAKAREMLSKANETVKEDGND